MAAAVQFEWAWRPQPGPQSALVNLPSSIDEVFYGGARGGGKTDGMLGKNALKAEKYGKHQKGIFFRRELTQLEAAIERCKQIYYPLGWNTTGTGNRLTFHHPNGATLKFRPLERDKHAEKYQGHDYTDVYFEELTNYPNPDPYKKMFATLRSGYGIPCQIHSTGNPGGPGHQWVRARHIDPAPAGFAVTEESFRNPFTGDATVMRRTFIPARLSDNPMLLEADPGYVGRLYMVGSAQLVKAWLDGDWNIIEGAFFDCWSHRNILQPFAIPDDWTKFRSFDWGSAKPFSCGWWAVVGDEFRRENQTINRGALIRYREWYGMKPGEPNVGLKLPTEKVAEGIKAREQEKMAYGVADPSIFSEDGGPSHAERFSLNDVHWNKADNRRVAQVGAMGGWDMLRERIIGTRSVDESGIIADDGDPMIFCFSTCTDSIRTIPALQHDEHRPEDVDTDQEDHCFVAGTPVLTESGDVPIEQYIRGKHGRVWSAGAWRHAWSKMTRTNASVVRLRFDNGKTIDCTPSHRFMDCAGEWRYAIDLEGRSVACDQRSLAKQSRSSAVSGFISVAGTFREKAADCIASSIQRLRGTFRTGGTFIISMETRPTTRQRILSVLIPRHTCRQDTEKRSVRAARGPSPLLSAPQPGGTAVMPGANGIASITTNTSARQWGARCLRLVSNAVLTIRFRLHAWLRASIARVHVRPVRCVSVEKLKRQPVYCLEVPETQSFTVHGLIVHNCADEWRYAVMSRPWVRNRQQPTQARTDAWGRPVTTRNWKTM